VLTPTKAAVRPESTVAPYTYRSALDQLIEYEGRRCLWRVAAGAVCLASVPLLAVGGVIASAYLAADLHEVLLVALGAAVAFVAGQFASGYLWPRRPWRRLLVDRLATYELIDGPQDLKCDDPTSRLHPSFPRAEAEQAEPYGGTLVPPLPDTPDLDLKLIVARPPRWHPPDPPEIFVQIRECLRAAGIRARVGSEDINPSA
jgi:hypothetical protein